MFTNPFVVGRGYSRVDEIHPALGGRGNRQVGIIAGKDVPAVVITSTPSGRSHGYEDGRAGDFFTYYGEGQSGDMSMSGGNLAILNHAADGKPLLWFKQNEKGGQYYYLGEFVCAGYFLDHDSVNSKGDKRTAIVFRLRPVEGALSKSASNAPVEALDSTIEIGETEAKRLSAVRSKQQLFRARLLSRESRCRITGISDQRFLRASHIKPWSKCVKAAERLDPNNGLLLATHADHLFDQGWISFDDAGRLLVSDDLPKEVVDLFGGALYAGKDCGPFTEQQMAYLKHHREHEFEKAYRRGKPIVDQLVSDG